MNILLNQQATLWPVGGLNASGEYGYGAPVDVTVRWEDKVQKFQHQDGSERIGNCVIYCLTDAISLGSKVARGSRNARLAKALGGAGLDSLALALGISREALDTLLQATAPVAGADYSVVSPWDAPDVRTVGSAGASPSLGGSFTLYKSIGE